MNKLDRKMFEDVVVFSFSEPGAMGPNDMSFFKSNGESFRLDYKSEETPYSMIKELFPVLRDCYWNGPMRKEAVVSGTIVLGGLSDDRETCVADGWRHIYLDCGNHIAVKKELYYAVKDIFYRIDNCDITFEWPNMLKEASFAEKMDAHIKAYREQEEKDEILEKKLEELKSNPEYLRKVKEAAGDLNKMMEVLEEFSGIKMTWVELKQFGFRRSGMI